jgi:putative Holliday junction resolvase
MHSIPSLECRESPDLAPGIIGCQGNLREMEIALRPLEAAVNVRRMRIGGLDVGDRRIGIAICDEHGWTAQGVSVLSRTTLEADLTALALAFEPYAPTTIVVGLPKNMNGTIGPQAEKALAFARHVEEALHVPTIMWDERLSTVAAERTLLAADLSRAKRRQVIDKAAAVYILQGYLDSLQFAARGGAPQPNLDVPAPATVRHTNRRRARR